MKPIVIIGLISFAALGVFSVANCSRVAAETEINQPSALSREQKQKADQLRRERYLSAHPDTREQVARAIRKGTLTTGMWVQEAEASIGKLTHKGEGGGIGGKSETWTHRDGENVTVLHFADDCLDYWSTQIP